MGLKNIFFLFATFVLIQTATSQSRCNYTLTLRTDEKAVLKNPSYSNNIDSCWFKYKVEEGYGIRVDFRLFELEGRACPANSNASSDYECCDYLRIGAGSVLDENALNTYCGKQLPESIIVNSSSAWFDFHTNDQNVYDGFKLELTPYKLVYKERFGIISSPDLVRDVRYKNNMDLTYEIVAQPNEIISVRIQKMDIENFNDTCLDYLEIGSLLNDTLIKPIRFCGENVRKQLLINTNRVYLRFVSDASVTMPGFELVYKSFQTSFSEPNGLIELFEYPMSVNYTITAPKDFKIELNIVEFHFSECLVNDLSQVITSPDSVCSSKNDHVVFSNKLGSLDPQLFEAMQNLPSTVSEKSQISTKWVFCACNKPAKAYISLGNQLQISYIHRTMSLANQRQRNSFRISYKFIPMQFNKMNQIRIVQDQLRTSFIDGYHLNVKVPANHHLRLLGRSSRCVFPEHSLLSKWPLVGVSEKQKTLATKRVRLNQDEFKRNCSYLIDINEVMLANAARNQSQNDWVVSWYLQFNSSLVMHDFELKWQFIKNTFVDEKQVSVLSLPANIGFEMAAQKDNDDELVFYFKSSSGNRKYSLVFEIQRLQSKSTNKEPLKLNQLIRYRNKDSAKDESIPEKNLTSQHPFLVNSDDFTLKIKTSHLYSIQVTSRMDNLVGDCDFDFSLCGYTSNLLPRVFHTLLPSQSGHTLKHLPKFNSIDMYDIESVEKSNDFYLAISKTNAEDQSEAAVYSPLVQLESGKQSSKRKSYSVSFSYNLPNETLNKLQLVVLKNHVESNVPVEFKYLRQVIGQYDRLSSARNDDVKIVQVANECPAFSLTSVLNKISLGDLPSKSESIQNWYHVKKVNFFSCYNFRIGFVLKLESELGQSKRGAEKQTSKSQLMTPFTVGLDDIELNQESEVKECARNVCGSNGVCYEFNKKNVCCCKAGFEGDKCEKRISACGMAKHLEENRDSICKNGGLCVDSEKTFDYECKCLPGFSGKNCEVEINECDSSPCQNEGKCIDRINGYECACKTGYNGENCQKRDADCKDQCTEYGTSECYNDRKGVICVCKPNFGGDDCSLKLKVNKCLSNPCVGNSHCAPSGNDFKCLCPEDRAGKYCEIKINFCDQHKNLCRNNGSCVFANKNGKSFECSCLPGFTGKKCEQQIDECLFNSCVNGKCVDLHNGYRCDCDKGYVGRYCDTKPTDPCYRNKCKNGICVPKIGNWGYNCVCHNDADGEFCEKKKCDKNKYMNEVCNSNGTLDIIDYNGKCHCICKSGFTGVFCESRLNFCEIRKKIIDFENECKNGGTCNHNNQTGDISCQCPKGFSGDRCEIVENYCKNNPCKYGLCRNEASTYKCECTKGWTGKDCTQPIEMCKLADDCVAENTQEVIFSKQSCTCVCKLGFTGDRCQVNIDDCLNVKCENGGTCHDLAASYRCECPTGFTGPKCDLKVVNCDSNPCRNGECRMLGSLLTCMCDRGFTGKFCDVLVDKCAPNPCQNSGVCHNLIDDYYCECSNEFGSSKNCSERLANPCNNSPCYNGATCFPIPKVSEIDKKTMVYSGFTCRCAKGYRGNYCELPDDPCSSNPCNNRGICSVSKNHEYSCLCYAAFTGKNCESHFDQCKFDECRNGGTCLPTTSGAKCICKTNYEGKHCEILSSPCNSMHCLNGGECVSINNMPHCKCANTRFIGTRCEIDISSLNSQSPDGKVAASQANSIISCDPLGNDVTSIDYIFLALIIFFIVTFIIAIVYSYVYLRIKKTKNLFKDQASNENEPFTNENSQSDKRYM